MGWDYCSRWATKGDVISDIKNSFAKRGVAILAEKSTSDGAWFALERDGHKFIYLALIKKSGGEYGVKDLDESAGPYYYSCPIKFFDIVPCPDNDTARKWRQSVIQFHAFKKANGQKRKLEVGMKVKIYNREGVITGFAKNKAPIVNIDLVNYRLKRTQVKDLEVIGK